MARFMTDGLYHEWSSQEQDPNRIPDILEGDPDTPAEDHSAQQRSDVRQKSESDQTSYFSQILVRFIP